MQKTIRRREGDTTQIQQQGLHPLLARLYSARGIDSSEQLELGLGQLIPPADLLHADTGARMLADAIARQSRLLIVGDFDADGATSTALAVSVLRAFGASDVEYLVPNRFEYGYGLTPEIVALAARSSPDIIVTVDNGISSIEGVIAAREMGIATLITDHHLPGRELPAADVIVNPNQADCNFGSKNLAGVGVIFYLMLALRAELRLRGWFDQHKIAEPNLANALDLVALGTVADVVPLDYNNRILVAGGLQRIRAGRSRPGIAALLEVSSCNPGTVVASDLGFSVGPRLNAAGRLDDMSVGIECLLSEQPDRARQYAAQLHQLNLDRRHIEKKMQKDALALLEGLDLFTIAKLPEAITLYEPSWHQGVIGILASRVKDRLHRPTIVFADGDEDQIKGSARSIAGVHIRDVLDAVATKHPGLIQKFGGHAMAAGLTLARASYAQFQEAFIVEVARVVDPAALQAVVETDGELQAEDLDLELATLLRFAGPWGQHFPEPLFDGYFKVVQQRLVGEKHLKLVLSVLGSTQYLDAIAFNIDLDIWPNPAIEQVELVYRLDVNEFRGQRSLQLMVEQIMPVAN